MGRSEMLRKTRVIKQGLASQPYWLASFHMWLSLLYYFLPKLPLFLLLPFPPLCPHKFVKLCARCLHVHNLIIWKVQVDVHASGICNLIAYQLVWLDRLVSCHCLQTLQTDNPTGINISTFSHALIYYCD